MPAVFVDSAAWIALIDRSDRLHGQARQTLRGLRQRITRLVTTEFVFLEVADALSAPAFRTQAAAFVDELRRLPLLYIVSISKVLFNAGWNLYTRRPNKEWGITDCISFTVMTEQQISVAFTSDHHFEQAGFTRLLLP